MSHHFVMTSSLRIKNFKIGKFGDFLSDIDYNSRTDIFRDAISLIINQCDPRRPKGASGGHKVSASRAAQASEARLFNRNGNVRIPYKVIILRNNINKRTSIACGHCVSAELSIGRLGILEKHYITFLLVC